MESIKVRRHIGQDGILHLDIPVGMTEREVEVMVIYQSVPSSTTNAKSIEQFYGCIQDDSFFRHPQSEQPERESLE
jgi:hypothetical protein